MTESLAQLEQSLQKARMVSPKERLQRLVWFKQGVVNSRSELAARGNRNPSTLNRWLVRYPQGGLSALLATRQAPGATRQAPGATRQIQGEALEKLNARLAQPEEFHSDGEIQQWLEQTGQLKVVYGTRDRVVRYELKAKPKVPRPRARQQDPPKLNAFPKNCLEPQRDPTFSQTRAARPFLVPR